MNETDMDIGSVKDIWHDVEHWVEDVDGSDPWNRRIFWILAGLYGGIALMALIQLIRIQLRVPEYGWTTQKIFHLLNFGVGLSRAIIFGLWTQVSSLKPPSLVNVFLDVPGLLFFSTYTLLVLFWAEIYHQARSLSTGGLRPTFVTVNVVAYASMIGVWIYEFVEANDDAQVLGYKVTSLLLASFSSLAALGFAVYGGRLYFMLKRFPIESKGRKKKLNEVGAVTIICALAFSVRGGLVAANAFVKGLRIDMFGHPLFDALYYVSVEILPAYLVLFVLRKLPPKRPAAGYQQIPTN